MCYTHKNAELVKKASFKCPLRRNPRDCNGHVCPARDEPPFDDYYSEYIEALYAKMEVKKLTAYRDWHEE